MGKIFVISPNRSATVSTIRYLENQGFMCAHWFGQISGAVINNEENLEYIMDLVIPLLDKCDVAADLPIPSIYKQLAKKYPDAKFLLIKRHPQDWANSILERYKIKKKQEVEPLACTLYWQYLDKRPTKTSELTFDDLAAIYSEHCQSVEEYFRGAGRLGVFSVDDPKISERLSHFLGLESKIEFPHDNKVSQTKKRKFLHRTYKSLSIALRRVTNKKRII